MYLLNFSLIIPLLLKTDHPLSCNRAVLQLRLIFSLHKPCQLPAKERNYTSKKKLSHIRESVASVSHIWKVQCMGSSMTLDILGQGSYAASYIGDLSRVLEAESRVCTK